MYLTLMNCTLKMVKIANFVVVWVFYHSLEKIVLKRQDIFVSVFEEIPWGYDGFLSRY